MSENYRITESGFVDQDGKLIWREVNERQLSDTGCVYVCYSDKDEAHMIYMLCRTPESHTFFWSALWNTCGISGVPVENVTKYQHEWESIEEAIRAKLESGAVVKRTVFSKLFKYFDRNTI